MIRFIAALGASTIALICASCNATSEPAAAPLRPLPQFQELPAADGFDVEYSK